MGKKGAGAEREGTISCAILKVSGALKKEPYKSPIFSGASPFQ